MLTVSQNPLHHTCPHTATPEEQTRDPEYLACNATPGLPCIWARRYDGVFDPPFHSERLESATPPAAMTPESRERFNEEVLATGLV